MKHQVNRADARLAVRVLVEYMARKRCGESIKPSDISDATNVGLRSVEGILEAAHKEGFLDLDGDIILYA